MKNKTLAFLFVFSLLIPTSLTFASPYFTTSIKPATKYTGRPWTPLQPVDYNFKSVDYNFTNPYAPLGSQFNPVYIRSFGTSGFVNSYANIGTQSNPVFTRPYGTSGFINLYAPLGTQFNPINFK